jgi:hypothetical protein
MARSRLIGSTEKMGVGTPQWSLAVMARSSPWAGRGGCGSAVAAMEPGRNGQEQGSRKNSLLTCANGDQREHPGFRTR